MHVLQEVLGESEEAKNKAIYAGTLMTTIQGTKDVINQLDRKQKLKMTRHSGNLISMLTGTKRLVDKIHEGELYCVSLLLLCKHHTGVGGHIHSTLYHQVPFSSFFCFEVSFFL